MLFPSLRAAATQFALEQRIERERSSCAREPEGEEERGDAAGSQPFVFAGSASERELSGALSHFEVDQRAELPGALVLAGAQRILNGERPAFDLRRGVLAQKERWKLVRGALGVFAAAAVIAVIALSAGMYVRAGRYDAEAKVQRAKTEATYTKVFPNERVPVGVKRRLESRVRKLQGLGGIGSVTSGAQQNSSVQAPDRLRVVVDLLADLPRGIRLLVHDLRVDGARVHLSGEARSHADANEISKSLARNKKFVVEPIVSESLKERGVSFLIRAEHRGQDSPASTTASTPAVDPARKES